MSISQPFKLSFSNMIVLYKGVISANCSKIFLSKSQLPFLMLKSKFLQKRTEKHRKSVYHFTLTGGAGIRETLLSLKCLSCVITPQQKHHQFPHFSFVTWFLRSHLKSSTLLPACHLFISLHCGPFFFNNVILFWLSYSPKHSNLAGSLVTCLWTYSCLPKSKVIYDDQDYIPHAPHHIYQTSVSMSLNHHHHRARLMPALTAFQLLRKRVFYFWVGLQVRQVFLSGLLNSPTCII